jgi:hypothetical protein
VELGYCLTALQGLDVMYFAKMKTELMKSISKFEEENQSVVGKDDFTLVFGRAFNATFTEATVKAAFCVTGIFPFSPAVIHPE